MDCESILYQETRGRLQRALLSILHDADAVAWVIDQRLDKVGSLKETFPKPLIGLVSFDVDHIKSFVFATTKPLEIQGASEMVKDLERDGQVLRSVLKTFDLLDDSVVFAAGGVGLILVCNDIAADFTQRLVQQFSTASGTSTCSAVWKAFAPHELIVGPDSMMDLTPVSYLVEPRVSAAKTPCPFGHIVRLLDDVLREVKEEKVELCVPPVPGYLHRCESCGIESASLNDPLQPDELPDRICIHCLSKRERGRLERNVRRRSELETAVSINDIVSGSERGFFAVLYADANNMGQALMGLESMADYALFSQTITYVMQALLVDLVQTHHLRERYQAPILGGDDFLLLLPADKVTAVCADLLQQVSQRFDAKAREIGGSVARSLSDITLSLGFVIVPAHFPIRFAVDYAESLLNSAKKSKRETGEVCLDYLVIKEASPLNLSVDQLRIKHFVRLQDTATPLKLTSKPFTFQKFNEMLRDVEALDDAGVSRSQLHQIESLLQSEPPSSIGLNLRYQLIQSESWKRFFEYRNGDLLQGMTSWLNEDMLKSTEAGMQSYFLDLLDLYEFRERR